MKTKSLLTLLVFSLFCSVSVSAQIQVDVKACKKEAKNYAKKGYQVNPGSLSLYEQLVISKEYSLKIQSDGNPEWVFGEGKSTGTFYDAARMNARLNASVELAQAYLNELTGEQKLALEQGQGGNGNAESSQAAKENIRTRLAAKLKNVRPFMECYRDLPNGNVEVLYRAGIPWSSINQSFKELLEEMKGKE